MNLDSQLKPAHRAAGLRLEDDEDFIYLTLNDEGIGIFRLGTTRHEILEIADRYVKAATSSKILWSLKNICSA